MMERVSTAKLIPLRPQPLCAACRAQRQLLRYEQFEEFPISYVAALFKELRF